MNQSVMLSGLLASIFLVSCVAHLRAPIQNAANRPTPLSFGLHVTPDPADNPIDPPERFEGFHVGLDFEVSSEELEIDVPVFAICKGTVAHSGFVQGYGGLVVQRCNIGEERVSVLYGHMALEGLPAEDAFVAAGKKLGILAPARSDDSDGNRKHLHLGIHRGRHLDFRGYVQTEEELGQFIDPRTVLPGLDITEVRRKMKPYWEKDVPPK